MKVLELKQRNLFSLIFFQKNFKKLLVKRNNFNNRLDICKNGLINMVSNLHYFNKINVFLNSNLSFSIFLEELKDIEKILEKLPKKFRLKDIVSESSSFNYESLMTDIINLQVRYSNHISCNSISKIFNLFGYDNWRDNFSNEDLEKIHFIKNYFQIMCVWDSEKHKNGVPMP